jgi:hypothetical protein
MSKHRKAQLIVLLLFGAIAAFGIYQVAQIWKLFGIHDQRVVQILESSDGKLKAELIRRYAFLDLNFIIKLNGKTIFISPDFKQSYKFPFRETILWDKTGNNLIFEVSGHRLFGYNVISKRQLPDDVLLSLEVSSPKLEDFGYEGQWPSVQK